MGWPVSWASRSLQSAMCFSAAVLSLSSNVVLAAVRRYSSKRAMASS